MSGTSIEFKYANFLDASSWYTNANEGSSKEMAYLTLGLVGEAGEFADQLKKLVREDGFDAQEIFDQKMIDGTSGEHAKKALMELGDVFWYATKLCRFLQIDPDELRVLNTLKLYTRMSEMEKKGTLPIRLPDWPFGADYPYEDAMDLWKALFGGTP